MKLANFVVGTWAAIALLSLGAGGCAWKGGQGSLVPNPEAALAWSPKPTRVRIYPSSRFVQENNQTLLEARLELLDEMGDSIKGVGWFRFELFADVPADQSSIGRRLFSWNVTALTLAQQRQYYDPITRTYRLRLKVDGLSSLPPNTVLYATFTPREGDRLEAQARLSPEASLMSRPVRPE